MMVSEKRIVFWRVKVMLSHYRLRQAHEGGKVVSPTHLTNLALPPQARVFLRVFGSSHGLSVICLDPGIFVV